jgi:hypothetical protein
MCAIRAEWHPLSAQGRGGGRHRPETETPPRTWRARSPAGAGMARSSVARATGAQKPGQSDSREKGVGRGGKENALLCHCREAMLDTRSRMQTKNRGEGEGADERPVWQEKGKETRSGRGCPRALRRPLSGTTRVHALRVS